MNDNDDEEYDDEDLKWERTMPKTIRKALRQRSVVMISQYQYRDWYHNIEKHLSQKEHQMDALRAADLILRIAKEQGKSLSPMSLVKICCIAQGLSLAIRNKPFFSDAIEAWHYGPIIPSLYRATRHYGRNSIPFQDIGDPPHSDDDTAGDTVFAREIVETYASIDSVSLGVMTSMDGSPWSEVRKLTKERSEIPNDLMMGYYARRLAEHKLSYGKGRKDVSED